MEENTSRTSPTTVWIDAFKVGDLVAHPKYGDVRYTEPQLLEAIRNFRDLSAKGYSTTVLREHGTEDSYVYGSVRDVRISEDGYFQCAVQFYRLEDRKAYNEGILREFSPGFAHTWLDPHTGDKLANVLLELSFTSRAYQRNLRPPQGINPGVVLSNNSAPTSLADTPSGIAALQGDTMEEEKEEVTEEVTEEEEPAEFSMSEFAAQFAEFAAEVRAFMAPPMEEEEPAAMSDEVTEVEQLSAQVAALTDELLVAKLSAAGIDAERIPTLVELNRAVSPDQFNEILNYAATPGATIQPEIGATGTGEVAGVEMTAEEIVAEANAAGVKYGGGKFSMWVSKNHPDRFDEITRFARL